MNFFFLLTFDKKMHLQNSVLLGFVAKQFDLGSAQAGRETLTKFVHQAKISIHTGRQADAQRVEFADFDIAIFCDDVNSVWLELWLAEDTAYFLFGNNCTYVTDTPSARRIFGMLGYYADIVQIKATFERAIGIVIDDIGAASYRTQLFDQFCLKGVEARD